MRSLARLSQTGFFDDDDDGDGGVNGNSINDDDGRQ